MSFTEWTLRQFLIISTNCKMKRIIHTVLVIALTASLFGIISCDGHKGTQTEKKEDTATLTLSNWEDTLAYALGVRYYQEKSTGYSISLNEYLEKNMERIYGSENYSEYFQRISQRGVSDATNGRTNLQLSFVGTFLNLIDCENDILKYEKGIAIEKDEVKAHRMTVSMNNTYKRIQFILRDQSSFPYSFKRIENYRQKRDSILALPPDKFMMPKTSSATSETGSHTSSQTQNAKEKSIGNWTLKNNQYESNYLSEENDKGCKIRFILSKGRIDLVFCTKIESDYEMKLLVNGNEYLLSGSRTGKKFTITSPHEISTILSLMERGNFTFQYMFLESGASHWGWYDFPIYSQLNQATRAYNSLTSE